MKKLILFFIIFLIPCSTTKIFNNYQSYEQLDSIFKAERILTYDSLPLQDYETKKWFYEYYFIQMRKIMKQFKVLIIFLHKGGNIHEKLC